MDSGQKRRRPVVVVVEDDPDHWVIYGKILWYNGYDVIHAADGVQGLRLARQHRPDLLIVDLSLPRMDGLELCRRYKEDPAFAEIPVLILTARDEQTYGGAARDAGCAEFLQKPQAPTDVLRWVVRTVGQAPPSGEEPLPRLIAQSSAHR